MIFAHLLKLRMGIKDLSKLFRGFYTYITNTKCIDPSTFLDIVNIVNLSGSVVVIDFSLYAHRSGSSNIKERTKEEMNYYCILQFLRLLETMKEASVKPVVVFDQLAEGKEVLSDLKEIIPKLKGEYSEAETSSLTLTNQLTKEKSTAPIKKKVVYNLSTINIPSILLSKQKTHEERLNRIKQRKEANRPNFILTNEIVSVAESICKLLGVEYHFSLIEGDWQITHIARKIQQQGKQTYILSEDMDMLLLATEGVRVLRYHSMGSYNTKGSRTLKNYNYESVDPFVMWNYLGLSPMERRACLGAVLGCDYAEKIPQIGPASCLHLLTIGPRFSLHKRLSAVTINDIVSALLELLRIGANRGYLKDYDPQKGILNYKMNFNIISDVVKYPSKCLKPLTSRLINPEIFNGMTILEVEKLTLPIHVSVHHIVRFLRYQYRGGLNINLITEFVTAMNILTMSTDIEEKGFTTTTKSPPSFNRQKEVEKLRNDIIKLMGKEYLTRLSTHLVTIDESFKILEDNPMDELGVKPCDNTPSTASEEPSMKQMEELGLTQPKNE